MKLNLKQLLSLCLLVFIVQKAVTQNVLDDYIKLGIQNNLVLKERNISLEKSLLALREAKTLFMPSVNLTASYTLAAGGRSIYSKSRMPR